MGILNVDNIQPVGGGTTITLNSSEINVGTGITFESNGQANFAGIVTATTFFGSGANLTNLPAQTTIVNYADNKLVTATGNATTLNAEANLTFNGTSELHLNNSGGSARLYLVSGNSSDSSIYFGRQNDGATGGIRYEHTDDSLRFMGYNNSERVRILSNGHIAIGDDIANDTGMFKVIAADGQSDDQYVGQFKNLEATTNRNWGLLIQAGSSSTDESLRIRNGANNADHLTVRGDGIVTKPKTPAFHVSRQAGDVGGNNYVTFDHVDYNNGNHYSNSTGRFTAPVTGIYFFSAWHYTGSTSAFYLRINTATFGEYAWDDTGGCATWVCPMTAGQYAQIYTKYTWRGSADYHNAFCGYLIG